MTQTQHTPGPWAMRRPVECEDPRVEYWIDAKDGHKGPIADIKTSGAPEANARLIAAAPQLLTFAKYVLEMDHESDAPLFVKARAAIKTATEG